MDNIARARAQSLAFRRTLVLIILPTAIVCSVASRLWGEMKSAVYLAKLDVREDIGAAREIWKR